MRLSRAILALVATTSLTVVLAAVQAQTPATPSPTSQTPDRIEEDWQLVVASPDVTGVGPQITTVLSATGNLSDPFIAFDMNYREYPNFTAGGMQVQVWSNNSVVSTSTQGTNQFQTSNETVTWTQRMSLSSGSLNYAVENGQSTTWGGFGEGSNLNVTYTTTLSSLSAYTPTASVKNSGVSWQSDRVTSLKLVQVRYYSQGSLYYTDTTARTLVSNTCSNGN